MHEDIETKEDILPHCNLRCVPISLDINRVDCDIWCVLKSNVYCKKQFESLKGIGRYYQTFSKNNLINSYAISAIHSEMREVIAENYKYIRK